LRGYWAYDAPQGEGWAMARVERLFVALAVIGFGPDRERDLDFAQLICADDCGNVSTLTDDVFKRSP
jgi:hypothetical protein